MSESTQEQVVSPAAQETTAAPALQSGIPPWMQQRLDQMTARMHAAERKSVEFERQLGLALSHNQALSAEMAQLKAKVGGPVVVEQRQPEGAAATDVASQDRASSPAPAPSGQQYSQEDVETAAQRLLAERENIADQERSAERGKKAYPDFIEKVGQLKNLGGLPSEALELAMETGAAEHVLYALGSDLNKAAQILALPKGKQAVEFAKLALKEPPAGPKTSAAPAPMTPIGAKGSSATEELRDDLSSEEWYRRRTEQAQARKAGRR